MQMYSMPVFDMIEASFRAWGLTRNKIVTRLIMRTVYVIFTCFVAVTLPFFGGKRSTLASQKEDTFVPKCSAAIVCQA